MALHFRERRAWQIGHEPDEVTGAGNADRHSSGRRHDARTKRHPPRHVRHRGVLRLEHGAILGRVRDLQHVALARRGGHQEILIALARQRRRGGIQPVQLARQPDRARGVESRRLLQQRHARIIICPANGMDEPGYRPDLALVFSGGGARAAYQVGFLRVLARECPDIVPGILTGVSAGGINAAYLASQEGSFAEKIASLANVWGGLSIEDVFRVDVRDLASRTLRWGGRLTSGGTSPLPAAKSLVDTAPLRVLLERVLHASDGELTGISKNLQAECLRAVALTASNYTTGQSITWVQTRDDCGIETWERPQRKSYTCPLRVDHVMASSALPFFFPAIDVDGQWYGDGGIRLTAPLSPAVHLGARRIIAVSTRYARSREEA